MNSFKKGLNKIHNIVYMKKNKKRKKMSKKETQTTLFAPFKEKLGKGMLSKLTKDELNMLQKGELNPDTLSRYKPFIDKLFPKNVRITNTAIHRDQGGATQPLVSMVFFGRQPNDPDLKRVIYEPVDIEPRVLVPKVIREK